MKTIEQLIEEAEGLCTDEYVRQVIEEWKVLDEDYKDQQRSVCTELLKDFIKNNS